VFAESKGQSRPSDISSRRDFESIRLRLPDSLRSDWSASAILGVILGAWIIYAGVFIYLTSALIGGVRYYLLFDDMMISMRYAANLAHGYGLVWNPHGARVEGFTDTLWVFIMALLHLMPVSSAKMSLLVQLLCIALGVINLLLVYQLTKVVTSDSKAVALAAVLLTAFYYPLNYWVLRGTEVALLTPLLTLAVLLAIRIVDGGRSARWLWLLLSVATVTRIDAAAPAILVIAMVALFDRDRRREHLVYGFGYLILFLGAQLLLNRWYYGSVLPNTYYLKMAGYPISLRLFSGLVKAWRFLLATGPVILVLAGALVWLRRDAKVATLAAVFGCQIAYSVYVGGDAWESLGGANRYIAIAMPLFVILFVTALEAIVVNLTDWTKRVAEDWTNVSIFAFLTLAGLAALNMANLVELARLRVLLLLSPPLAQDDYVNHLRLALDVDQLTDSNATIAVTWAGIIPYFANRYVIDLLGKNDAIIAHEPMHIDPSIGFLPGHLKWDYHYSIGRLRPDVILETVGIGNNTLATKALIDPSYSPVRIDGNDLYFRKDSSRVLWNEVEKRRQPAGATPIGKEEH
jgi:arabinofuranosyltransferase